MLLEIIICCILLAVATVGFYYYKFRIANRVRAPKDVVLLYQVGRGPRAPSFSPFPMKLETFLRMTAIPYINDHAARFSSKGKTPWIELNGKAVADSQLAIEFLKKKFGVDADGHLTEGDKAVARAFLKLTEENLYWTMCIEMFGDNLEPVKTVIPYRGFKLWLTVTLLRRALGKQTWGHGIGRHTKDEVWDIAVRDMNALSNYLGTKKFLMGDEPSEVDCSVFGMIAQIYWHMPGSKHQVYLKENLQNLVDYIYRMKDRFWPDWESMTLEGSSCKSDHGELHMPEKVTTRNGLSGHRFLNGTT
ncbi:failed axon connections homolog [Mercenaria mercenaria]|uniref:failed axon connections homolog n=1 Tax=Mercenaria mercenaria TaxID=6596 RepID=UPI00234F8362|nr:failed axon connections homolog [Mercenaria mercenaria]